MALTYTDDQLLALSPARLENVRANAWRRGEKALVEQCERIQAHRRPVKRPKDPTLSTSPVVGFHFKCVADYEVTPAENGRFWSGVWVVDDALCQPAIELRGYVALHDSKREQSYRQGRIVGWRLDVRSKGKTKRGVSFLLEPLPHPFDWFGKGSGEKGYRRLEDQPRYEPD